MAFRFYNPNPSGRSVGDCTVRAISKALGQDWYETYIDLAIEGFRMGDMPTSNAVWGSYLRKKRWIRYHISNSCPDCYTVEQFAHDHPDHTFILALSGHVVCVTGGDYFDSWDSGNEIPLYYWTKG